MTTPRTVRVLVAIVLGVTGVATFIIGDLGGARSVRAAGMALVLIALVVALVHVSTWR